MTERERCALHVRAMIGILKRGAGQVEPWDRLAQALEHIERGDPANEMTQTMAEDAELNAEAVRSCCRDARANAFELAAQQCSTKCSEGCEARIDAVAKMVCQPATTPTEEKP